MKLQGRVALVTGASRGIGRAIATTFAREGASVVLNYFQTAAGAERAVEEIRSLGGKAISLQADVSDRGQVQRLVDETVSTFGRLDILVNNGAVRTVGTVLDAEEQDWDRTMGVNLRGPFNCMQLASRIMVGQRYGKILNISSRAGVGGGSSGELAYSTSKAGLITMTISASLDLGQYGINVNCIAPGWTVTDMAIEATGMDPTKLDDIIQTKSRQTVIGRVGYPQDIANLALFLVSDDSSFITGQVITADGGRKL